MTDMEKVTKGLEICKTPHGRCAECPYNDGEIDFTNCTSILCGDALAMLKELQQQIWELEDQVEYLTDKQKERKFLVDSDGKITPLPDVVRCKDCKYGRHVINTVNGEVRLYRVICVKPYGQGSAVHEPDWFCADGERKTDDA